MKHTIQQLLYHLVKAPLRWVFLEHLQDFEAPLLFWRNLCRLRVLVTYSRACAVFMSLRRIRGLVLCSGACESLVNSFNAEDDPSDPV